MLAVELTASNKAGHRLHCAPGRPSLHRPLPGATLDLARLASHLDDDAHKTASAGRAHVRCRSGGHGGGSQQGNHCPNVRSLGGSRCARTGIHLVDAFRVATGAKDARLRLFGLERPVKWLALYVPAPWPHGYPAPREINQTKGVATPLKTFDDDPSRDIRAREPAPRAAHQAAARSNRAQDRRKRIRDVLAIDRTPAGELLVQRASERPDVCTIVNETASRLLRAHVSSRAEQSEARPRCQRHDQLVGTRRLNSASQCCTTTICPVSVAWAGTGDLIIRKR